MFNRIAFIIAGLIIGATFTTILVFHTNGFSQSNSNWEKADVTRVDRSQASAQQVLYRNWVQVDLEKKWEVGGEDTDSDNELILTTPVHLKEKDDTLFVLDSGLGKVSSFSPDGHLVRRYGEGHGQGPGEFEQPTDLTIAEDGSVHICDDGSRQVKRFSQNGTFEQAFRTESAPYRCTFIDDNLLTIMYAFSENLFGMYDVQGSVVQQFGTIIENQRRFNIALDGFIVADGRGGFVYGPIHAGKLFRYGGDGAMIFESSTVDPAPFPDLAQSSTSNGALNVTFPNDHERKHAHVAVHEDEIFLLAWIYNDDSREQAVDVYSIDDGTYLRSFQLPERVSRIAVNEHGMYSIFQTSATLAKWKISH